MYNSQGRSHPSSKLIDAEQFDKKIIKSLTITVWSIQNKH